MRLTDTEWQLMNCLWEKHPATARGIAGRLPPTVKWAYTTIRTLLARLVDKARSENTRKATPACTSRSSLARTPGEAL